MFTVSQGFLSALRGAHTMYARADVYRNDALVYADVPFDGGEVQVNSGAGVRRSLGLSVPDADQWDTLVPIGTELRVVRGIRFPGVAAPEVVPLGVFVVDSQSVSLGPSGGISITAPDRWAKVQRARFEAPQQSVKGARVTAEISRLVTQAVPGVSVSVTATSTATVGALVWDRDRDQAINDLCSSIGAEAYFDWTGNLIIRDAPLLSAQPITWRVDASPSGVLLGGERSRSRDRTYNVVVVSSSNADGAVPFAAQTVADTDPASPTYIGGTMGRVPFFFSSPLISTPTQALAAGRTILNRVKGLAAQLTLESVVNPALDRGDVFYALLPDGTIERHLAESFNVPLTPDGAQSISTRSSRPEGEVPTTE